MDYPETHRSGFPEVFCGLLDNPALTDQTVYGFHYGSLNSILFVLHISISLVFTPLWNKAEYLSVVQVPNHMNIQYHCN